MTEGTITQEIIQALRADRDVLAVGEDGWAIEHALSCRPNLLDCPVHREVINQSADWDGPPVAVGRYYVTLDINRELILEPVTSDSPEVAGVDPGVLVVTIDLASGQAESRVVRGSDYVITATGECEVDVQVYATGTHVLTVRGRKPERSAT